MYRVKTSFQLVKESLPSQAIENWFRFFIWLFDTPIDIVCYVSIKRDLLSSSEVLRRVIFASDSIDFNGTIIINWIIG